MKTMNGFTNELLVKKAKRNWKTRCGAFLLAVLAAWHIGGPQDAYGQATLTVNGNLGANTAIDADQWNIRTDANSGNVGAGASYNINYAADRVVNWVNTNAYNRNPLGLDLFDITTGDVSAYLWTTPPQGQGDPYRSGMYNFNIGDAFAANGETYSTNQGSVTWGSGNFNATGTYNTGGNRLTIGNAFNNAGALNVNNGRTNSYTGWLVLNGGSNAASGTIDIGTAGVSIGSSQFSNLGIIDISTTGRLHIQNGVTFGGTVRGAYNPVHNAQRGQILLDDAATFGGSLEGSICITGTNYWYSAAEADNPGVNSVDNVVLNMNDAARTNGLTDLYITNGYNIDSGMVGSTEVRIRDGQNIAGAHVRLQYGYLSKVGVVGSKVINNTITVTTKGGLSSYLGNFTRDDWDSNPDSVLYDLNDRFTMTGNINSPHHGAVMSINEKSGSELMPALGTVVLTTTAGNYSGSWEIYGGTLEISDSRQLGVHDHNYDDYNVTVGNTTDTMLPGYRSAFRVVGTGGSSQEIGHNFGLVGDNGFYEVMTVNPRTDLTVAPTAVNDPNLADASRFTVVQNGKLFGAADLNKSGDGRLVLASKNNQQFTGNIVIHHGIVSIEHAANLGNSNRILVGTQQASVADAHLFRPVLETTASLTISKTIEINQENSVIRTTGADNRTVLNGKVTSGSINGISYVSILNKEGAGTLVLSGENNDWYNGFGETAIREGTLEISSQKNITSGAITIGMMGNKDQEATDADYHATLKLADYSTAPLINNIILGHQTKAFIETGIDSILTVGPITEALTESDLNKSGKGTLVLDGKTNGYTGWTNVGAGTIIVKHENSLSASKGVDMIGDNTLFDMSTPGANQVLYGVRGYDTVDDGIVNQDDYNTKEWTREVRLGGNTLTLNHVNDKDAAGATVAATNTYFHGNITADGGKLIKEGDSLFASGFTGFDGEFVINKGTLQILTDTTVSGLSGKKETYLDVRDKVMTVDVGTNMKYDGTIISSSIYDGRTDMGTFVKRGAATLTANFWDKSAPTMPVGFQGSLVMEDGHIYTNSEYHMAGGNSLTVYYTTNSPLTLDVGKTNAQSGTERAVFQKGGASGTANSKVYVMDSGATWNTSTGKVTVGRILANGDSDYSGLEASDTNSLFTSVSLRHVYGTDRHDLYIDMDVHGFGGVCDYYNGAQVGKTLDEVRVRDLTNSGLASLLQDIWAAGSDIVDPETGLPSQEAKDERAKMICGIFKQMSGDTIANAMYMGLDKPWQTAFDRLNLDCQMVYVNRPGENQGAIANMRNLWFTPTVQSLSVRSDGNARKFGIDRPGFKIGLDKRIAQNASLGWMLGYSDPKLHQGDDRVTGSDFQFGVYGGAMVGHYVEMKGYIGFGHQNYKSNRTIYLPNDQVVPNGNGGYRAIGGSQRTLTSHGRFDGDTFNFSFEISRPLFLGFSILRPTIGLDSEHAFRYGFTETGDATSMKFKRSSLSRTRARFGLALETTTFDRAIFTGRIGYATLLGGHDYATASGQYVNVYGPEQSVRSVAVGTSYFEAGVGTQIFLNPYKTLALFGNYDASIANRWAEHQAAAGIRYYY